MADKNLQKTASTYRKQTSPHIGILRPRQFVSEIRLECYEPSPDMAPFVAHYFIARRIVQSDAPYTATDVQTYPAVSLLLTGEKAVVMGVASGVRTVHVGSGGAYAGVKFRVGGFRAFWDGQIADLTDSTIAADKVFSALDKVFSQKLLTQDDQAIAAGLEAQLRAKRPRPDKNSALSERIIDRIAVDHTLRTAQDVAHAFGKSERSLQALFNTYVGVGVKWFLMRNRFLEAMQHAHGAQKPNWTEIAANLGYSTQSHFINDFKKIMGQSPSSYFASLQ